MKAIRILSFFLLIAIHLNSCKQPGNIPIIDFDQNLKAAGIAKNLSNNTESIDLCKIVNVEWDLIWIIPPYAASGEIDKINAENFSAIKSKVDMAKNGEGHVQLAVVKQNKVVAYGQLSRRPLDLAALVKPDGSLISISKENCGQFTVSPNKSDPGKSWTVNITNLK